MNRPAFLTSPGMWLHSRRIAQTQAEYACAVEQPYRAPWGWRDLIRAVVCVAAAALIGALAAQGV